MKNEKTICDERKMIQEIFALVKSRVRCCNAWKKVCRDYNLSKTESKQLLLNYRIQHGLSSVEIVDCNSDLLVCSNCGYVPWWV